MQSETAVVVWCEKVKICVAATLTADDRGPSVIARLFSGACSIWACRVLEGKDPLRCTLASEGPDLTLSLHRGVFFFV